MAEKRCRPIIGWPVKCPVKFQLGLPQKPPSGEPTNASDDGGRDDDDAMPGGARSACNNPTPDKISVP